jgi:methylmalonyl-CoA/ethylmalonyl-CoA epimerase
LQPLNLGYATAMHLHQVAQHATNLDRAAAFYEQHLGASVIANFTPPGLLFMRIGGTRVLFEESASSTLLYFGVDDIHATVERLREAGVKIETEPHVIFKDEEGLFGNAGETEWMAFFRDSENNLVGLVSRVMVR